MCAGEPWGRDRCTACRLWQTCDAGAQRPAFPRVSGIPEPSTAMHLSIVIVITVLEIGAILFVVALCVAARRADARTERMLSRDEREARQRVADAPRRRPLTATAGRWLRWLFGASRG